VLRIDQCTKKERCASFAMVAVKSLQTYMTCVCFSIISELWGWWK